METRILILKAGSGASNNLIRSLKAGAPSLSIVGCHDDRFVLKKSMADRNYVVPVASEAFAAALKRIIETERIELVIPTNDVDVLKVAALRENLPCRTFLPGNSVIQLCQDKYKLTEFLRSRSIPAPLTYPIAELDDIESIFEQFAPGVRLWCRIRAGTGSFGAIPVKTPGQTRSWIQYWEDMRGIAPGSFTLAEYLPGRDFCVQSLWKNGSLILTKMAERLVYFDNGSPSGVSSTPALARTAFEQNIVDACTRAIRALDSDASGVFFLDIKESAEEQPCITEVNAGRFATITNIHDLAGKHNMAVIYVRLALDEPLNIREAIDFAEDFYLVRSVDTLPAVVHREEFFRGIQD